MAEPVPGPRILSPRQIALAERAAEQRSRVSVVPSHVRDIPAWMNRRTGKPHEHNRARARRLRRVYSDSAWAKQLVADAEIVAKAEEG